MSNRYDTAGNPEDEYYPGTEILINKEGIQVPEELLLRETQCFFDAYTHVFTNFDLARIPDLRFFYQLHYQALGPLYKWAGKPRTVLISKSGTPFCAPDYIDASLRTLFDELKEHEWLEDADLDEFLNYLSYLMCELNAIHPFREGNARTIRFFADVLTARNFRDIFEWANASQEDYLQACISGFSGDYGSMRRILDRCLPPELNPSAPIPGGPR